jgi:hypothetical protein
MQAKLDLLIPDWLLQYDSWRQFLEVIEQSVNEVSANVDDLKDLYDLEKAKEFIVRLANNFGFGEIVYQDLEKNLQLLDNQYGFIEWKGSEDFFERLLDLFEITAVVEDLSKSVLIYSWGRGWDCSAWEDAKYFRDGSIEVTVSLSQYPQMKELERFVHAGVYVWYKIITGLQLLGLDVDINKAAAGAGESFVEEVECSGVKCYNVGEAYRIVLKSYGLAQVTIICGVANEWAAPVGSIRHGLVSNEYLIPMEFIVIENMPVVIVGNENVFPVGNFCNRLGVVLNEHVIIGGVRMPATVKIGMIRVLLQWKNLETFWFAIGRTVTPWDCETDPPVESIDTTMLDEICGLQKAETVSLCYPDPNGSVEFKGVRFTLVPDEFAYDHDCRYLYCSTVLRFDDFPLVTFRQYGIYVGVVPAPGNEAKDILLPDEVLSYGKLIGYINIPPIIRNAGSKNLMEIVIEFEPRVTPKI